MQLAFNSRIRTYHTWQNADAEVRRVKQNHERTKGQVRIPVISMNVLAEVGMQLSSASFFSVAHIRRLNDEPWTPSKSSTIVRD
jgi:predicted nucleic acid-binding protein